MNEIYWITRLDAINLVATVICVSSTVALVMSIAAHLIGNDYDEDVRGLKKTTIPLSIIAILSTVALIFTPTTKQAYMIFGLGTTIDYCKNNEKVQELPDKTIKMLDKFIDEYLNEENE